MARVSRKKNKNILNEPHNIKSNIYYAAIYLRLSQRELETNESNKIENQKELLLNFISEKEDIILKEIYCDNGATGTNFKRMAWNKLMTDIESGYINCIIVKDLSRLGRNYLETQNYLDNIFPQFNIRFISVNDNYDTCNIQRDCFNSNDIIIPLKNILNAQSAKDISEKIFSAKEILRKKGKFTGNVAPYGYKKDENDKYHLVINDETAHIIRRIFKLKLERKTNTEICKILNSENIPPPYKYLYDKGKVTSKRYADNIWKNSTIKVITGNQMYIGDMVQGKKIKYLAAGITKVKKLNKIEYIIIHNTHEQIIEKDIFFKVQEICKKELELNRKKRNSNYHI